jgi:DNA-binding NtrC family response regulator
MSNRNLLIVDDEATSRDALARALASHGYTVRTAADAHQATQLMAQQPADTVLLDIELPHVPGDSLATFFHIRYPKTRIIFISGQYDMFDPERFGEHTSYFRKPIDINTLLDSLNTPQPPATSNH